MSNKTDLTEYSSQELSLNVFNDEYLYKSVRRFHKHDQLRDLVSEFFIFDDEQFDELCEDWDADQEEMEKECG